MERPDPADIPATPGVYLFKDSGGRIIYVGKAVNLRRRVLSYFRPGDQLTPKTAAMRSHAAGLEFLTVTTEKEALLLEASLIKKHRPHYNICLRDDKQYVMFRLSMKDAFPRLEIVRRMKRGDGARYFGPYTSGLAARETWKALHRVFHLRRCSDHAMANRVSPCLYHHIHLCSAPCAGLVSREEYAEIVHRTSLLLSGRSTELADMIRNAMEQAAERLEFEKAAELRDQLRAVQRTVEKQGVVLPGGADADVIGLAVMPDGLALGIVFVRHGLLQDRSTYFWPGLGLEEAPELLAGFPGQFYHRGGSVPARIILPFLPWKLREGEGLHALSPDSGSAVLSPASSEDMPSPFIEGSGSTPCFQGRDTVAGIRHPQSVPSPGNDEERPQPAAGCPVQDETGMEALEAALSEMRGGPVRITVPHGADDRRLLEMACSNARESARTKKDASIAERLGAAFRSSTPLARIECADVSHTGGEQTKVGMVVYENGSPCKGDYRTWNIEGAGGDDFLALSLWARKRAEHGEPWPDLLLIDGGRGQISAVDAAFREVLEPDEQERLPFLLAGIAKARDERGHADRRAGNIADRIFIPGRSNPLPLREGCPELLFLQVVRDAAHDFSIGRHRQARARHAFDGELGSMPGLGRATARLLWERFDSVAEMKAASVGDLLAVPGIGPKKAAAIFEALKKI